MQVVEDEVDVDDIEPVMETDVVLNAEVESVVESEVNQVEEENDAAVIISSDMSDETPQKSQSIDTTEDKKQQIKHYQPTKMILRKRKRRPNNINKALLAPSSMTLRKRVKESAVDAQSSNNTAAAQLTSAPVTSDSEEAKMKQLGLGTD